MMFMRKCINYRSSQSVKGIKTGNIKSPSSLIDSSWLLGSNSWQRLGFLRILSQEHKRSFPSYLYANREQGHLRHWGACPSQHTGTCCGNQLCLSHTALLLWAEIPRPRRKTERDSFHWVTIGQQSKFKQPRDFDFCYAAGLDPYSSVYGLSQTWSEQQVIWRRGGCTLFEYNPVGLVQLSTCWAFLPVSLSNLSLWPECLPLAPRTITTNRFCCYKDFWPALWVTSDKYCPESKRDTLRSTIILENQALLWRIPEKSYEADDWGAT